MSQKLHRVRSHFYLKMYICTEKGIPGYTLNINSGYLPLGGKISNEFVFFFCITFYKLSLMKRFIVYD